MFRGVKGEQRKRAYGEINNLKTRLNSWLIFPFFFFSFFMKNGSSFHQTRICKHFLRLVKSHAQHFMNSPTCSPQSSVQPNSRHFFQPASSTNHRNYENPKKDRKTKGKNHIFTPLPKNLTLMCTKLWGMASLLQNTSKPRISFSKAYYPNVYCIFHIDIQGINKELLDFDA